MGLDQYAYVSNRSNARREFYDDAKIDKKSGEYISPTKVKPREISYWRKHPNLQGWMQDLWTSKGKPGADGAPVNLFGEGVMFNGVELELTIDDINKLEHDIKHGEVARLETQGFFFGNPSDEYYREQDLQFCADARFEIFCGNRVFYNSSW